MVGTRSSRTSGAVNSSSSSEEDSELAVLSPSRRSARIALHEREERQSGASTGGRSNRPVRRRISTEVDALLGRDQGALRAGWPVREVEVLEEEDLLQRPKLWPADHESVRRNNGASNGSVRQGKGKGHAKYGTKYGTKSLYHSVANKPETKTIKNRVGGDRATGDRAGIGGAGSGTEEGPRLYSFRDRTNLKQPDILTYNGDNSEEDSEVEEDEEEVEEELEEDDGEEGERAGEVNEEEGTGVTKKKPRYKFREREVTRRQVFNITADPLPPRRVRDCTH
ncbi:unnamed protein product [Choristocarpus tenellus]